MGAVVETNAVFRANSLGPVFAGDPLVTCGMENARLLFKEMCDNTKEYLARPH